MSRSKDNSRTQSLARWATALIALAGMLAGWHLTDMHIQSQVGDTVGGALCDVHASFDCQAAVDSRFSAIFGIPISLLGMAFYASILVLTVFESDKARGSKNVFRPATIATVTFGLGVLYSIFLAIVSLTQVGSICPFCAVLYGVNIMGFISSSIWAGMWPQDVVKAQVGDTGAFYNGWTGLFVLSYGVALLLGMILVEGAVDNRIADERRSADERAQAMEAVDPGEYAEAPAPAKGPEDAPVQLVEFSSFGCPHCGTFAQVVDQVAEEYDEELRVEFRHFPLGTGDLAHGAARAAHCADEQGEFWQMHETLFANRGTYRVDDLPQFAEQLGLDVEEFEECIDDPTTRARVDADRNAGRELGVQATPTFFVNGVRYEGALPVDELRRVVERELADAQ